jgi:hypothetical protein
MKSDPDLIELVKRCAPLGDAEIARILNMKDITTPKGARWTQDRVKTFRKTNHLKAEEQDLDGQYLTAKQAAHLLNISRNGVLGLLRIGALTNHRLTDFAPGRIPRAEVESDKVKALVAHLKQNGRLPKKICGGQGQLSLGELNP